MKLLPEPEHQLEFLNNIQRLLSEGLFVATYKYALLLSLADICVERGNDTGDSFKIETEWISEKFINYYWRQVREYPGASMQVLKQNTGKNAAVITSLKRISDTCSQSLVDLKKRPANWRFLVRNIDKTVREMPLWKLQTVGDTPFTFLYENTGKGKTIKLKPSVMFCFRKFHELLSDLVRGAWIRYIRRQNQQILGSPTDLDEFLFGSERASLATYEPILREVQASRCFYCGDEVTRGQAHIDHFIPWSRYPVDLGHNFVFTHSICNSSKAEHLAATGHLSNWVARNRVADSYLRDRLDNAKIVHDLENSHRITQWAYSQACLSRAMTWTKKNQLEPLGDEWIDILN